MALVYRLFPADSYPTSQAGGYFETGGLTAWTFKLVVSAALGAGWTLDAKVQKSPLETDALVTNAVAFAQVIPATVLPYTDAQVVALAVTDLFIRPLWTVGGNPSLLTGYIEASATLFDIIAHLDRLSRQLRQADDKQSFVDRAERKVLGYLQPSTVTRSRFGSTTNLGYLPRSFRVPLDPDSGALAFFLNRPGAVDVLRDAIAAQASLDYDRWRLMGGAQGNALDRQTAAHMPQVADEVDSLLRRHMRPNISGWPGR